VPTPSISALRFSHSIG